VRTVLFNRQDACHVGQCNVTTSYFKYDYEEDWIADPMVKEMIQDVDKSTVIDSGVIDSPVLEKNSADWFIWWYKDSDFGKV
jgi:hypothetical protein